MIVLETQSDKTVFHKALKAEASVFPPRLNHSAQDQEE